MMIMRFETPKDDPCEQKNAGKVDYETKRRNRSDYIGIIGGTGPAGTTPLPAVTEEYPRLICHN
jgi:hypothetical protein